MASAELQAGVRYDMPPAFGPSVAPDVETGFDVHASAVEFETTPDALVPLLPKWFRPTPRPRVSFGYRQLIGLGWMGGRSYQLLAIRASVVCELDGGTAANTFGLAIWESDCAPIVAGRELMGAPKLFGNIPPIEVSGADHGFECREYDALLVHARVSGLRELSAAEVAAKRELQHKSWVYYWKYIPGVSGEPDADYPVAIKLHTPFVRMWQGCGALELGIPSPREAPYSHRILQRLAALPRRSDLTANAWHANGCTLYRNLTRRLDR